MENSERDIWDIDIDEQEYLDLHAAFGEGYVDLSLVEFLQEDVEQTVDNVP